MKTYEVRLPLQGEVVRRVKADSAEEAKVAACNLEGEEIAREQWVVFPGDPNTLDAIRVDLPPIPKA